MSDELRFTYAIKWGKRLEHGAALMDALQTAALDDYERELRHRLPARLHDKIRRTKASVIVDDPSAKAIEHGSRPHWVPIAELKKWATSIGKDDDPGAAYRIQRSIAAHGTPAHPFAKPALDATDIDRAIKRGFDEYFRPSGL